MSSISVRDGLSIILHEELPLKKENKTSKKAEHIFTRDDQKCNVQIEEKNDVQHISIIIEKGQKIDKPIMISSHYTQFGTSKISIHAQKGSQASINRFILEHRTDKEKGHIQEEVNITIDKEAELNYNERTEISPHSIWESHKKASNKGRLRCYSHLEEGKLLIQEIHTNLEEKHSSVDILHTTHIQHKASNTIHTTHQVGETRSSMKSKNVVAGELLSSGLIRIEEEAQDSTGEQHSNTLLIEEGVANTHPQLEIHNADVTCSHGSSTGQIEEETLFYLQSRGLSEEKAKKMIINGHLQSIIEETNNNAWKADILTVLNARKQDIICLKCSLSRIDQHNEVRCTCN